MVAAAVPVLVTVMACAVLVCPAVVLGKARLPEIWMVALPPEPVLPAELLELQPVVRREREASRQTTREERSMVGPLGKMKMAEPSL